MCMNCGCGEPETRHKPTDITSDDIKKASGDGQVDKTVQNMRASLDKMGRSGSGQQGSYSGQTGSGQQNQS